MSVPKDITLRYFNIPGRGEPSRLAMRLAGVAFNDDRIAFENWGSEKQSIHPWGSLPVLIADGVSVYQSMNIHLYVASFTGLIPDNILDELKMRECMFALEDVVGTMAASNVIPDLALKTEARAALCVPGGKLHGVLVRFEQFLGDREYVAGNKLSMGDICLFTMLGTLLCGVFDGVPSTLLDTLPVLERFFKRIASRSDVKAAYESETAQWAKVFRA